MAEKYMFFNSIQGDKRTHQASDIALYWKQILTNGIFHLDQMPKLEVLANTNDMRVTIEPGSAHINGQLYLNDEDMFKHLAGADALLDRIDRIVLRWDDRIENRYIKAFVVEGVPSAEPIPPQLTRTENIHELSLAQIRVRAGKSFIEQSDIVDERLVESLCGIVSSLVTVPTDVFLAQWDEYMKQVDDQWKDWFNSVFDASLITGEQFRARNREVDRQLANLNAMMDVDNRAIGNTGKFYDLFDDSNEYSIAKIRTSSTVVVRDVNVGDTSLYVQSTSGFNVGDEVTICYAKSLISDEIILQSNIIIGKSSDMLSFRDGSISQGFSHMIYIYRSSNLSDKITLYNWTNVEEGDIIVGNTITSNTNYDNTQGSIYDENIILLGPALIIKSDDGSIETIPNVSSSSDDELIVSPGTGNIYKYFRDGTTSTPIWKFDHDTKSFVSVGAVSTSSYVTTNYYSTSNVLSSCCSRGVDYFLGASGMNRNSSSSNGTVILYKYNETNNAVERLNTYDLPRGRFVSMSLLDTGDRLAILAKSEGSLYILEYNELTNTIEYVKTISGLHYESGSSISYPCFSSNSSVAKTAVLNGDKLYTIMVKYVDGDYEVKEFNGSKITNKARISLDGNYILWRKEIYAVEGDSLISLTTVNVSPSTIIINWSGEGIIGWYPYQIPRYYTNSRVYTIPEMDLRYDFNQPIKNLAGWFFTNKQLDGVQASISLVDSDQPEDYKPLTVTQNGNEYEFLETTNLTPKDKATLKLTITGKPNINKLLGAIE